MPNDADLAKVTNTLLAFDEIAEVHDVHIWSMDGQYNVMTAHLVLSKKFDLLTLEPLKKQIRRQLEDSNIEHATLEFELKDAHCDVKVEANNRD